ETDEEARQHVARLRPRHRLLGVCRSAPEDGPVVVQGRRVRQPVERAAEEGLGRLERPDDDRVDREQDDDEGSDRGQSAEPSQGPRFLHAVHASAPQLRLNEPRLSHRYIGAQISASTSSTLLSAAPSPKENTWKERLYDQAVI